MTEARMSFAIRGEGSDSLEIDIYDQIGETWDGRGMSARKMRGILRNNQKAKSITLRVNSGGGDVIDGFAIYQLLMEHPANVVAEVDALAASMASVIIMAADTIRASKHSLIMVHNPWSVGIGDAEDMRKMADLLDKVQANIADAYVQRTGAELADVLAWMDAETWMRAEEARDLGFVDEVKEAKAPSAEALTGFDLSAFAKVPDGFARAVASARRSATAEPPALPAAPEAIDVSGATRPAEAQTTPAGSGADHQENDMDLKTLKKDHPEVFEAAVAEGAAGELRRVKAHITMGQKSGAMDRAIKAILGSEELTIDLQAEYMAAGMDRRDQQVRQEEADAAGTAASGAAPINDTQAIPLHEQIAKDMGY